MKTDRSLTKKVKQFARDKGADIVGIASMDRFEGAPKEFDPRFIFPDARAAVVMGFRIPRGCFRGIEEGTYFAAYASMGYSCINLISAPIVLRHVCLFLEDEGYEAVPIQNMNISPSRDPMKGKKVFGGRVSVDGKRPSPDVQVHFRLAAVAAGLGEIGYSKVFLSPEFGPRQRLAMLLTDAPLEPDSLFSGKICDRCMLCVKECTGKAISRSKTVKTKIAGKKLEWGELDEYRCAFAYTGLVRESSPFLPPEFDFEEELRKARADKNPYSALTKVPYNETSLRIFHHLGAIEGAKGCMRACMMHLEETGRIKARFKERFRKRKPWSLR